ncbi:hypothetical protein [Ureibacillus sp. FSL W7-1570]|uniref:YpzI-like protein n=1 Tax=Ureibacillus suwonensis TaxID=313007 RepID=A0ABW0RCU0_9BACL
MYVQTILLERMKEAMVFFICSFLFSENRKTKINLMQGDNRQSLKDNRQSSEDNRRKEGIIANEVKSK